MTLDAKPLDEGQIAALRNLARKRAGDDVDWINIADARGLTEIGLAERNREGWMITEAGLEALKLHEADAGVRDAASDSEGATVSDLRP